MKHFVLILFLVAVGVAFTNASAQQAVLDGDALASNAKPASFAEAVNEYFTQWDINGDGKLSPEEIVTDVSNPKFHGEAAAAIAAIEKVVRGGHYDLPPLTKNYLLSCPLREPAKSDQQTEPEDDVSKSAKFDHPPSFQSRYMDALRKLHETSHDLFPQSLPSFEATHQGKLGDCPFVSTVGAMVYRDPAGVKAMFAQDDRGSTKVTFGDGRSIRITHLTDADIAIWSSAGTNGLWMTVLEKAYRRILQEIEHPDRKNRPDIYEKFSSSRTIEILDGHQTRKDVLREIQPGSPKLDALRKSLKIAQREHLLVKAATPGKRTTPGITPDHAYAVLGYDAETDLVHVWNPHGNNFVPKGPDGLQNGYTTKTGQFTIPLSDMLKIFSEVTFEIQTPSQD